jgi:hypothetical protein
MAGHPCMLHCKCCAAAASVTVPTVAGGSAVFDVRHRVGISLVSVSRQFSCSPSQVWLDPEQYDSKRAGRRSRRFLAVGFGAACSTTTTLQGIYIFATGNGTIHAHRHLHWASSSETLCDWCVRRTHES